MMKRAIIFSLILALCSAMAYAEPFTLHNGTQFGMSYEEVEAAETECGFEVNQVLYANGQHPGIRIMASADKPIAGSNKTQLSYSFDESGSLFMMDYYLPTTTQNNVNDHNMIRKQLTEKYGEPVAATERQSIFLLTTKGSPVNVPIEMHNGFIANWRQAITERGYNRTLYDWAEWMIRQDDGYVFIQLCLYETKTDNKSSYTNLIAYVFIDQETYDQISARDVQTMDDF